MSTGFQHEHVDFINKLMGSENSDGQSVMEQCFFILFETMDESYIMFILEHIPNIEWYMYITNDQGWFPLFRVLHLFQPVDLMHQYEKSKNQNKIAQNILTALFSIKYDFLKPSLHNDYDMTDMNTFEMLMMVPLEPTFLK